MDSDGRNGDPQPFASGELENYNGDWSLSCDMRLLSNFKSLSGTMFERAEQVLASIEDVSYKTEEKAVKVSNVVNDLQMLATNQFIENRVYEESEETLAAVSDVPELEYGISDPQNIVAKIRSSLNQGMEFVRHNVPDIEVEDDSDEEDNIRSSLRSCLRQHRFLARKLPPLVGGHEFSRENFVSLFRSRDSPEVITDAVDAVTAIAADNDDDGESDCQSEADIVISSSDSDDMFMPPENKQPPSTMNASVKSKSANIFSDSSSPETESVPESTTRVLPVKPLSFPDELSRRLLGNKQQDPNRKPNLTTNMTPNQTDGKVLVHEPPPDIHSGSSVSASAPRDRLSVTSVEVPKSSVFQVPQNSNSKGKERHPDMKQQHQKQVTKVNSASRKLLDFLSDDDDDEFSIFKTNPAPKAQQSSAKVSKLFSESEESASDTERSNDRKAVLPAKDSSLRRGPEKEVGDARRSETRHAVATVDHAPQPPITSASLFEGEASSEDDLFSSKVVHLPSDPQTSINTSAKSHVKHDTHSPKDLSERPLALSIRPDSPDDSDSSSSSPEQMNRSAIASKLEKTIFGNKSRKPPAGAISLFGEASLAKKPPNEPANDLKNETVVPQTAVSIEKAQSTAAGSRPPVNIDDDVFAGDVLSKSTTLSSQAVKSRPRVQNRRKPTRAAVKPVQNDITDISTAKGTEKTLPAKETQLVADVTAPDKTVAFEAGTATTIKSDASDGISSSNPLLDKKQIPHSPAEQLKAGHSDPDPQQKEGSSKTPAAPVNKSKILFDDSDEDLFAPTPQQVPAASAAPVAAQHPPTDIKPKAKTKGLFSDSEDDDIFPMTKKTVAPLQNNSSVKADHSLFDSSDEDSRPSQPADKTTAKADQETGSGAKTIASGVKQKSDKKQSSSLFSEDSDDDDLFKSNK